MEQKNIKIRFLELLNAKKYKGIGMDDSRKGLMLKMCICVCL